MVTFSHKKSQGGKRLKKYIISYKYMSVKSKHNSDFFNCYNCNYSTKNKSDWKKHISTKKHLKNLNKEPRKIQNERFICANCGREYKYRTGLSRHAKVCTVFEKNKIEEQQNQIANLQNLLEKTISAQNDTLNNLMSKVGNTTNNYNNQIAINLFLNNECKNAMNLTDFMNSLQLSVDDLDYTKNNGYIKGITNIFVKNLRDLNPRERPIHCSDKNSLQFYVKEENKWEQDNQQINKSIDTITHRQIQMIKEWEDEHPNWNLDEKGTDSYMRMVKEIIGSNKVVQYDSIKKEIGGTIDLDKVINNGIENNVE